VLLIASSSSVYGESSLPFIEDETPLSPTSYYGATKVNGERIVDAFAADTGIPALAMRFFTAYGPWGRPDMAYFRAVTAAQTAGTFQLFGDGRVARDFTYVDDIVDSIVALMTYLNNVKGPHFEAVNIGGGRPVSVIELLRQVSILSGGKLRIEHTAANLRDAPATGADFRKLRDFTGLVPQIELEVGLRRVWEWAGQPEIAPLLQAWVESSMDDGWREPID